MRYLIVSDIHANRQALEAVTHHARGGFDAIACLGDIVGYGADPAFTVDWTRENAKWIVRGNHDKAVAGLEDLEWFNPAARAATLWTQSQLTVEQQEWLRSLPQGPAMMDDFALVHGSPLDEDEYLLGLREAVEVADYIDSPVSFFGHTHLQGGFQLHRNGVRRVRRPDFDEEEFVLQLEDAWYLLNPGSVGQPRDGDPRAAYAIFDSASGLASFRRVLYDIAEAQRRIRAAGLPPILADRLAFGS